MRDRELIGLLVSEDRERGRVDGITEVGEGSWETIETQKLACGAASADEQPSFARLTNDRGSIN